MVGIGTKPSKLDARPNISQRTPHENRPMAGKKNKKQPTGNVIASNRRAPHNYRVLDTYEAGVVLRGSEIKSIRNRQVSVAEAYGRIVDDAVWIIGMHINEYFEATSNNHMPLRKRKLLLHKKEIRKIEKALRAPGTTLVPLDLHLNERGFAKISLGVCEGKKDYDKRADIKKREMDREISRYKR